MKRIEYMQRRSIRAVIDAPFCCTNEIVEIELGFCKMRHVLWQRALMLRGRMLANEESTFDGEMLQMNKAYVMRFEVYCRELME